MNTIILLILLGGCYFYAKSKFQKAMSKIRLKEGNEDKSSTDVLVGVVASVALIPFYILGPMLKVAQFLVKFLFETISYPLQYSATYHFKDTAGIVFCEMGLHDFHTDKSELEQEGGSYYKKCARCVVRKEIDKKLASKIKPVDGVIS